jgi:hypothetical protein
VRLGGGALVSKARGGFRSRSPRAPEPPLEPDITYDLRLLRLADEMEEREAEEHFEALRREADERA